MQDLKKDMDKLQQGGDDPTSAERKQDHIELQAIEPQEPQV